MKTLITGAAMPQRIECVDDRALLIADHPHFLEIDADRPQIFRNIADVLVLGAARQDLATDHQERGRDSLFGSRRVGGWHGSPAEDARMTHDGRATTFIIQRQQDLVLLQPFLISIFCCFFATSAGFGKWMCNTPLSNFASTFAGSGSNGRGIARLNEP